jgi:DNA invertase Pin-like site-specific DNA recombinase
MMMQMVGAFAEFERAMLRERTKAGLDAARQQGRMGGRRPKFSDQQQAEIRKMVRRQDRGRRGTAIQDSSGDCQPASGPASGDTSQGCQTCQIMLTKL